MNSAIVFSRPTGDSTKPQDRPGDRVVTTRNENERGGLVAGNSLLINAMAESNFVTLRAEFYGPRLAGPGPNSSRGRGMDRGQLQPTTAPLRQGLVMNWLLNSSLNAA